MYNTKNFNLVQNIPYLNSSSFILRYEDFIANQTAMSSELLNFTNLRDVQILESRIRKGSPEERYATNREKDYNPFQWKEKLTNTQVKSIESICEEYMNIYGYKLTGNSSYANSTDSYVIIK